MKKAFGFDESGSVSVMMTFFLVVLAGVAALCIQSSDLYVRKLRNQRTADLADLAAANSSSAIVNATASPLAVSTASNIATINGYGTAQVVTTAVPSPTGDGSQVLTTSISTTATLLLGGLIGSGASTPVTAASWAKQGTASTGTCVQSLLAPVNIYGSSVVNGSSCGISADTYLYVCGNAKVQAGAVSVGYSASSEAPYICTSAQMTPGKGSFTYGSSTTDAIATSSSLVAIKSHLAAMGSPGWPYGTVSPVSIQSPSVTAGSDKTYGVAPAVLSQTVKYGNLTLANSTLTFTGSGSADPSCTTPTTISGNVVLSGANTMMFGSGCYVFGGYILAQSAANVSFGIAPGASVRFVFKQYIQNSSGTMTFGDASYSLNGNVNNSNGGNMTFGNGVKAFGAGISNGTGMLRFGDGPHYVNGGTISNGTGSVSFGNGSFYLWGGSLSNSSTGTIIFGTGPFYFYGGTITNLNGQMTFGNGPYYFQGGSLSLSGASSTQFGVGNVDFYGGSVSLGGASATFGYGGAADTGSSMVSLYGGSLSLTTQNLNAVGVTFAFSGGTVSLLGAGTINATAPTGGAPTYGYQNILFVVLGGAFNLYQSNASDTLSGLIYAPQGDVSIYGSQTVNSPAGGCFGIVGGTVDIYQSANLQIAPCAGLPTTSSGSAGAALVQ